MAAVKGSKQRQMIVVPYRRPLYKVSVIFVSLATLFIIGWGIYEFGMTQGKNLEIKMVREHAEFKSGLAKAMVINDDMRREIANLKLGKEVDSRALEEVRLRIKELQNQIAQLDEELLFYKVVMLQDVGDHGLRIRSLDVNATAPNRYRYSLLLTQVSDRYDYIQGDVQINLKGLEGQQEKALPLRELDNNQKEQINFRFKYFQNIDGELALPQEFEPQEFIVVAQSSGQNAKRLEKRFNW
ncbi:MAG: hypothetical protein OXC84_01420 [Gammaproteobacteria bacterium]|nr:hypothetical protein [Gammaproteobacteria bacterium]